MRVRARSHVRERVRPRRAQVHAQHARHATAAQVAEGDVIDARGAGLGDMLHDGEFARKGACCGAQRACQSSSCAPAGACLPQMRAPPPPSERAMHRLGWGKQRGLVCASIHLLLRVSRPAEKRPRCSARAC